MQIVNELLLNSLNKKEGWEAFTVVAYLCVNSHRIFVKYPVFDEMVLRLLIHSSPEKKNQLILSWNNYTKKLREGYFAETF